MPDKEKTYVADERMQKFFTGLLQLKDFVKNSPEFKTTPIVKEIFNKLDSLIKEGN